MMRAHVLNGPLGFNGSGPVGTSPAPGPSVRSPNLGKNGVLVSENRSAVYALMVFRVTRVRRGWATVQRPARDGGTYCVELPCKDLEVLP